MSDPIENFRLVLEQNKIEQRTIVPGIVNTIDREDGRERDATFAPGPGDLVAGEAVAQPQSTDVPVLTMAGGGFFLCLPTAAGDEALGLVADRGIGEYVDSREPGAQSLIAGRSVKTLSDLVLTQFAITAPAGAPDTWDSLLLGGPAGVGIQIDEDGTVTITGQADAPATPTTIVMQPGGDITLTVGTGNAVNIGGVAAVELAKAQIINALQTAFNAAVTAAVPIVPPNGDGGTAGFTALANSFSAASVGNALQTIKAKGE